MNTVILCGRLTKDPQITTTADGSKVARYTLAVDRRFVKRDDPNAQTADFIGCVVFGKAAEFVDNYLRQGTKILIRGRIQTGSYTNKDGQKVYTTDVVVDEHEFSGGKSGDSSASTSAPTGNAKTAPKADGNGFVNVDDSVIEEDVPFL